MGHKLAKSSIIQSCTLPNDAHMLVYCGSTKVVEFVKINFRHIDGGDGTVAKFYHNN